MDKENVCSECKLYSEESVLGDGWCELHQRPTFCDNMACEDGLLRERKKKIYISLPISGLPLSEVVMEAEHYKEIWKGKGYEVVTPFDLSPESDKPYSYHMGKDIEGLLECDAVYFAEGWNDSRGCNLERAAAEIYGKEIHE